MIKTLFAAMAACGIFHCAYAVSSPKVDEVQSLMLSAQDKRIKQLKADEARTITSFCGIPFGPSKLADSHLSSCWDDFYTYGPKLVGKARIGAKVEHSPFYQFKKPAEVQVSKETKSVFKIVITCNGKLYDDRTGELTKEGRGLLGSLERNYGVKAIELDRNSYYNIEKFVIGVRDRVFMFPLGRTSLYLFMGGAHNNSLEMVHDDWLSKAVSELASFKRRYKFKDYDVFAKGTFCGLTLGAVSPDKKNDGWRVSAYGETDGLLPKNIRVSGFHGNKFVCHGICSLDYDITCLSKRVAKIKAEFFPEEPGAIISLDEEFTNICAMVKRKLNVEPSINGSSALFRQGNMTVVVRRGPHIVLEATDSKMCALGKQEGKESQDRMRAK